MTDKKKKPNLQSEGEDRPTGPEYLPGQDVGDYSVLHEFTPLPELMDRVRSSSSALDAQLSKLDEAGGTNRPEVAFAKEGAKAQIYAAQAQAAGLQAIMREQIEQRERHHVQNSLSSRIDKQWDRGVTAALALLGSVVTLAAVYLGHWLSQPPPTP